MPKFKIVSDVLVEYNGDEKKVKIPLGVKVIGAGVFANKPITQLELGGDVTKIEEFAFEGCGKLKHVILKNALETIEKDAFKGCLDLTDLTIPTMLASEGDSSRIKNYFEELDINETISKIIYPYGIEKVTGQWISGKGRFLPSRFTTNKPISKPKTSREILVDRLEIVIPTGVRSIGPWEFANNEIISKITLPTTLKKIEDDAFHQCIGARIEILSKELEYIGDRAFIGCFSFNHYIEFPDTVKHIGADAFVNCYDLQTIVLPSNLETLGNGAFGGDYDKLESVQYNGKGIAKIGKNNFSSCKDLNSESRDMLKKLGFKL